MIFNIKVGFFATIFFFLVSSGTAVSQSYDVIIRNGRIVDGTGNPWFKGDIGISGDKIAYLGDLGDAAGKRELDATGLYVTPGFIDTHSHSGPGLSSKSLSSGRPLCLKE